MSDFQSIVKLQKTKFNSTSKEFIKIKGGGGRILDDDKNQPGHGDFASNIFPTFDYIFSPTELECTDWKSFVSRKREPGERRA